MELRDPILLDALEQIAKITRENGRVAGIWVPDIDAGQKMNRLGYKLISISTDTRLLTAAAQNIVTSFKS
jgi:2-keto-3-deoxy-L-rhamnonate aldolase RhmA